MVPPLALLSKASVSDDEALAWISNALHFVLKSAFWGPAGDRDDSGSCEVGQDFRICHGLSVRCYFHTKTRDLVLSNRAISSGKQQ